MANSRSPHCSPVVGLLPEKRFQAMFRRAIGMAARARQGKPGETNGKSVAVWADIKVWPANRRAGLTLTSAAPFANEDRAVWPRASGFILQGRAVDMDHDHHPGDHHRAAAPRRVRLHRRDWRKVHHSPVFWAGVVLFLLAITIYLASGDLAWRPRLHQG